jgi:hypothetical protein
MKRLLIGLMLLVLLTMPRGMVSSNPHHNVAGDSLANSARPAADNPKLNLTYYTDDNPIERPVTSGSRVSGDHVRMVASWTPALVSESRLEIVASAIPATLVAQENDSLVELDTRALGNNATCIVNATAWLINGSVMSLAFTDIFIGNFFIPHVTVIAPNGGETWTGVNNITWTASDVNAGESLRFDVLVSNNSGVSYVPLAEGISATTYQWNSTGIELLSTYVVKVRVTDGIYFSDDTSDSPFTAGDVTTTSITSPTTSTTTSTTTNGEVEPRIIAFIVILLISSSIMALIVYYAARKWF